MIPTSILPNGEVASGPPGAPAGLSVPDADVAAHLHVDTRRQYPEINPDFRQDDP